MTTTTTHTRTGAVEAVMKIVTELRKKHQPVVDGSTDRVSTVGLVLEAQCHISAVCSYSLNVSAVRFCRVWWPCGN
jgi:hypothetical protein